MNKYTGTAVTILLTAVLYTVNLSAAQTGVKPDFNTDLSAPVTIAAADITAASATNSEPTNRQTWIIKEVKFKDKVKTQTRLVLGSLRIQHGKVFKDHTLQEIRKMIQKRATRDDYFVEAEVQFEVVDSNKLILTVELKEKWYFFPIPAISYSDKKWTVGMGFLQANFLGTKSQLGLAGLYKDDHFNFSGIWNINRVFVDGLGVFISGFYVHQDVGIYNNADKIGSYDHQWAGGLISWRYKLSGITRIWLRFNLLKHNFENPDSTALPQSGNERLFDLSFIIRRWTTIEDHETGYWMRFAWGMDAGWLGSDYQRYMFSWSFHYAINPWFNHNLLINQQGVLAGGLQDGFRLEVGSGTNPYTPSIQGYKAGQFLADYVVYHGFEYRIPVASHKLFIFSIVPFFQHYLFKEHKGDWRGIASYGISARVYLRKLMLPAVSVYVVYPKANKEIKFGAAVGASI